MSGHPDVLIVGGGVIGLTTAYYLALEGVAVTVLDQGEIGRQASWAGAGIVPPANLVAAHSPPVKLRALSCALFPKLSEALRQRTGVDNGWIVCGGLELPTDGDDLLTEEWAGKGISFQELDRRGIERHLPDLVPSVTRAYYLPQMAQVRNPRHVHALTAACADLGVRFLAGTAARKLVLRGGRVEGVDTDQGRHTSGRFLLAAGAWTDELLEQVRWRPGIRPIRGQIALLDTGRPGIRLVVMQGKRYLVPRQDGRLLIGSTEEDVGFAAHPTAGGVAGLLEFAVGLVPALAGAPLEKCWAGLRPGSPDGLPFLGPVPGWDNLFVAAGHFRAGIQLSPATGVVMAELLTDRPTSVPLEAFRLDRPTGEPAEAAFRN
jgi:glycine oxidase